MSQNELPHISMAKATHSFGFWLQIGPSSHLTQSLAPTMSNPVYSTQIRFPLPTNKCPHISLAKTKLWQLSLGFWLQIGTPLCLTLTPPQISCILPQLGFLYLKKQPPAFCLQKPSPGGSVLIFWSNRPSPLHLIQLHSPPTASNPVYSPQLDALCPENSPPAFHSPKLSSSSLVLCFWPNQCPIAPYPIAPPCYLKLGVPCPNWIPSTQKTAPLNFFAKTELRQLSFVFLAQ